MLIIKPLKEYHVRSVSEKEIQIDSTLGYLISHCVQTVLPIHFFSCYQCIIFQKHCRQSTRRNEYTNDMGRAQLSIWVSLLPCYRQGAVYSRLK